jgi:uncharacterized repeat protein (TIGR01451 family)
MHSFARTRTLEGAPATPNRRLRLCLCVCLCLAAGLSLSMPRAVSAAEPASGFTISSFASPSSFSTQANEQCLLGISAFIPPCDRYTVTVTDAGAQPTDGTPVTITDSLPSGLTAQSVSLFWTRLGENDLGHPFCTTAPVQCTLPVPLAPDEKLTMIVYVTLAPGTTGPLLNRAVVAGGGTPTVATGEGPEHATPVGSQPPPFGISELGFLISGADGSVDTQAGDHPYELTTNIGFRSILEKLGEDPATVEATSVEDVKDVLLDLPLGFVGSALAAPQCTLFELSSQSGCPADTQVGQIMTEPLHLGSKTESPIWNLVPEHGVPAEFGFKDNLNTAHIFYVHVVPSSAGYVLRSSAVEIPQIALRHVSVTFFGDPAAKQEELARREGKEPSALPQVPFFTNPTSCTGQPLRAVAHVDSWQHPGRRQADGEPDLSDPNWAEAVAQSPPVTGCNLLAFGPSLSAQPTVFQADTPSGLNFELSQPQSENVGTLATATLKNAVVKLPDGVAVDPSAADGLAACDEAQIGWVGPGPASFNAQPQHCPEASKIGTLELETPLISHHLTGGIYLASQDENPFHSTLAAYVVVDDPVTGVLVKIAGRLMTDPGTGQLTAIFEEDPNLPFSDLKLSFFGGPRGELATPETCGVFTTTSELTPWSFPQSGPPATPFDRFTVATGCVNGFNPVFTAGSTNLQAGEFTPVLASFGRSDTDQELAGLSVSLPPGLLATIAGVALCPDTQAGTGSCPEASRVGTVTALAGPGPNPLITAGNAYLTGPYKGAPYGLSVVVPAKAGPFDFGNVVVRQALYIDPRDAHVTDVSDPFPTSLHPIGADGHTEGIPIKLRRVDVSIDRPGFTFNPTSCNRMALTGSVTSVQDASVAVATPFQVTNCAALSFTPHLTVTTNGATSRQNGASLNFKIAYPKGALGSQSWFNEAKFDIPRQLPARLTTIQKACLAATFETNRGACPAVSKIGHAVVHSPVLPVPLEGPVYFVSYGGAKFPDAVLVLDGYGVHIELHGETFINSKTGVTSATFRNTPDVPFESIEVNVPAGPFSEFGANLPASAHGSFCGQRLVMPTFLKASNGAEIHQNTRVGVSGCSTRAKVVARRIKGHNITLNVYAPAAGKLTATAKGLTTASKTTTGTETVTLTLRVKHPGHARRHLRVLFAPAHGHRQTVAITLRA